MSKKTSSSLHDGSGTYSSSYSRKDKRSHESRAANIEASKIKSRHSDEGTGAESEQWPRALKEV